MEDNGWLAVTGPGMLASSQADQMLFRLQRLLDQAHIILLLEWAEGEDRSENRCRFDAHQHRRMHTAGYRYPIGSDDVQVQRMLIDLGQQRRSWNGEHKGLDRLAWACNRCGPFEDGHQCRLQLQAMDLRAHLFVGGQCNRRALVRR